MSGADKAPGESRWQPFERLAARKDLLLAAAYVSDAQYNRNIRFETSPQSVRLYYYYNHWVMKVVLYFFICVDLSLAIFERPALIPLPYLVTSVVEVFCLAAFSGRLVHYAKITPQMFFWKDTKIVCIMVTIQLTLLDLLICGVLEFFNVHSVRWSRALRPVFLINFPECRQIRRACRTLLKTLPDIFYVFFLFLFSLLMFSLMALKIFGHKGLETLNGAPYFTNIPEIAFELYVLVTAANSPDVMMPAYNISSWYSLYFITFIIINTYMFMSVFLAVVYNNYRKHLKNEIRKLAYLKRYKMIEAFNILKVKVGTEFVVKEAQWKRLVKVVAPDVSSSHLDLLLRICDEGRRGYVDKVNFLRLADLLNIQVVTISIKTHPLEKWMPRLYQSPTSRLIQKMVRHRIFVWVYDIIILIHATFIALDEQNTYLFYTEWLFLFLYVIEFLLKLYTHEPRGYFGTKQFWNWFDTLIFITVLLAAVITATVKSARKYKILDIALILRTLRPLRVIVNIKRFKVIMTTLVNIGPTIVTFGGLLLLFFDFGASQLFLFCSWSVYRSLNDKNETAEGYKGLGLLTQRQAYHRHECMQLLFIEWDNPFKMLRPLILPSVLLGVPHDTCIRVAYYVFAIIGMELFHDKIQYFSPNSTAPHALECGNQDLKNSEFVVHGYCRNNFNDLASAFILLVELSVVNQWHILASGFALVTHDAAKLYFIMFHIVMVILIVNIFISFILETFFVAYSLEKSEVETAIEKKIQELGVGIQEEKVQEGMLLDDVYSKKTGFSGRSKVIKRRAKGLYFRISSQKYKTVDTLLQRMFESEIAPEDECPTWEEILKFSPSDIYPKNPNFENSA